MSVNCGVYYAGKEWTGAMDRSFSAPASEPNDELLYQEALSLSYMRDAVVEDDEVADARIARGGAEDAMHCGMGLVHGVCECLGRSRGGRRMAIPAPVAGQFLARGVNDAAVYGIAEVDDVESRDGVAEHHRTAKRIRDGKRKDGAN